MDRCVRLLSSIEEIGILLVQEMWPKPERDEEMTHLAIDLPPAFFQALQYPLYRSPSTIRNCEAALAAVRKRETLKRLIDRVKMLMPTIEVNDVVLR